MKKIILSPVLSLLTLALIIGLRISDPFFVETIRLKYYDTLITSLPSVNSESVVIANIDEKAIEQYGQWPFSRDVISSIIENLYKQGAGLVVWNTIMSEEDRFGYDQQLSETLQKYPVILSNAPLDYQKSTQSSYLVKRLKLPSKIPEKQQCSTNYAGVSVIGETIDDWIVKYPSILTNISILEHCAAGSGITNTFPEVDGVTRRLPMIVKSKDIIYPNVALETLRVISGDPSFQVKVSETGIQAVRIPQYNTITTDSIGRIWLTWNTVTPEFSVSDIPVIDNKIVIVGLSAIGLSNPVPTSAGAKYPHYLQSSVIDTLISGNSISIPDWAFLAEIGFTLLLSIISLLLIKWKYGFIPVIGFIISIHYACTFIFDNYHLLIDATFPIVAILGSYIHIFTVKFLSELNAKLQIKKQFGGYLSPIMVEKLQKNPDLIKLGGEKKELTIVMTDLRGFSGLGESFGEDVEGLTQIMNDYMTAISTPVLTNDGCIIKFIGDASLHVHNAPLDDNLHHYHAVKTGLEMIEAVEKFNEELVKQGKPMIGMGVGINTGQTLIGNIGSKARFGYDVLGDSVSTAARLEGQTKPYGVKIIISESTAKHVEEFFFTLELDIVAVKGKTIGTRIYTVLPFIDANSGLEYLLMQQEHDKMLELYRQQNWIDASIKCNELMGEFDGRMDDYYKMMLDRIKDYRMSRELPLNWDGVFVSNTK